MAIKKFAYVAPLCEVVSFQTTELSMTSRGGGRDVWDWEDSIDDSYDEESETGFGL